MSKSFSGCELVELGIQIEKNGKDFYMALAEKTENDEVRTVFEDLAEAEGRHIETFKKLFDASCSYEPAGAYPEEFFSYMNVLASQYVFTKQGKGAESAEGVDDYKQGIALAIRFEKDSILFYEGMKDLVPESDRALVAALIDEEKKHLSMLTDVLTKRS